MSIVIEARGRQDCSERPDTPWALAVQNQSSSHSQIPLLWPEINPSLPVFPNDTHQIARILVFGTLNPMRTES